LTGPTLFSPTVDKPLHLYCHWNTRRQSEINQKEHKTGLFDKFYSLNSPLISEPWLAGDLLRKWHDSLGES